MEGTDRDNKAVHVCTRHTHVYPNHNAGTGILCEPIGDVLELQLGALPSDMPKDFLPPPPDFKFPDSWVPPPFTIEDNIEGLTPTADEYKHTHSHLVLPDL